MISKKYSVLGASINHVDSFWTYLPPPSWTILINKAYNIVIWFFHCTHGLWTTPSLNWWVCKITLKMGF